MKRKLIILGLFICSLGFGQIGRDLDTNFTHAIIRPSEEMMIQFALDRNNPTIFLMRKYKEECYNDSIEVDFLVSKNELGYSHYTLPSVIRTLDTINMKWSLVEIPLYEHKQPTFEGFINWIEKKLNN